MKTRTIVSIAAATLMTGALAIAAPGHGAHGEKAHGGMHGKMGAMHGQMAEKLNLSEAQKTQMKQLMESFRTENQALMDSMKQTRDQLREARQTKDTTRAASLAASGEQQRAEMQLRRDAQHEKMLQILTPEQRTQMEEMRATMEQKRGATGERGAKRMKGMKGHAHQGGSASQR